MIACAWFPNWPIQRLQHARPELKGPFAIHVRETIVAATNANLVGLPVAEVTVRVEEHDPQADRAQLESLAQWCDQFSPIVGIEGESLLLDVTGVPFDVEQATKAIRQQGFVARVAVTETVGAAWALAHYEEPFPVAALRLEESTLEMLAALGIRYVFELRALPRDQLAARFEDVVKRLDQLTGAVAEPITPYREPPEIVVERNLEYPLESREMIAAVCDEIIVEIACELSRRQQGAARLELALDDARFVIGLFQPSDLPCYLRELVKMQLERVRLVEAVTKIGLAVLMAAPLRSRQRELFDDGHDRERQLGLFVDRIRCRSPALRAVLVADAQPEHAFRYEPLTSRKRQAAKFPRLRRPLLVEPRPTPVDAISGSGPPRQFSFRGETHRTIRAWGPERILTGWWHGGYIRRDYYRVETTGGCYWLFRAGTLVLARSFLMPELPEQKRVFEVAAPTPRKVDYAELHCITNFSFLEGASHPDELVSRAGELGYRALAITDRNSLAGVVRAHAAAIQNNFKLLIGTEIVSVDAAPVVLLATDRQAYGRLARLITRGRGNAPKGECRITFNDVAEYSDGLLACPYSDRERGEDFLQDVRRYREVFGDRCYLLVELHHIDDEQILGASIDLAKRAGVPAVAAGGVHFHVPERRPLADVLTAIRVGRPVADCGELLLTNAERHLKTAEELARLFPSALLRRAVEVADRCTFSLKELRYEYPEELAPPGETPLEYLTRLVWDGANRNYRFGIPDKVRQLLEYELKLIKELHYEAYFLTVWDLVRFARSRGILCQGRGSAANSAVCYVLGVTLVDPEQTDVLFERFISKERDEAPDIDVDFEHERREEVIQYVYDKYGRERAGMTAVVITYRPRSAIRDVGKALGLSLNRVDVLAKTIDMRSKDKLADRCRMAGLDFRSRVGQQLLTFVGELVGFPRHLSQHVGGMVITNGSLCELVPIENATMEGRTVIEWDKDDLDDLGILKVDCLALGMLTAIRKCFALVKEQHGCELTLANIPQDDKAVYAMICQADTIGVFQIESRAQMSMLPRLKPNKFYDLVIEVAIVRPGPIQGDMVHPYLRRRARQEEVPPYPSEAIEKVLSKTCGVPLFQEQAMQLAVVAAGFSRGEADQLRRAMAGWRRPGIIDKFHEKLIGGMLVNGLTVEFAERVFQQIKGFGEYGFPESHAASFAILAYVSAWLKCHYPAAFCAALINSQPMGFYAPAQLVRDAQKHGIEVRPVDVNHSCWDCTLEGDAMHLGLRMVRGMSRAIAVVIEQAREAGEFRSFDDFVKRTNLEQPMLTRLSDADAFRSLALDRRQSLWQSLGRFREHRPLFDGADECEPLVPLLIMNEREEVSADYQAVGLSLKAHPISFYRTDLDDLHVISAASLGSLKDGQFVCVAGLVLMRQHPGTAGGITFVTLEDETGQANLIIKQNVWERFYKVAQTATAFIAHGRLQKYGETNNEIIHIIVSKLENMVVAVRPRSRDFH